VVVDGTVDVVVVDGTVDVVVVDGTVDVVVVDRTVVVVVVDEPWWLWSRTAANCRRRLPGVVVTGRVVVVHKFT